MTATYNEAKTNELIEELKQNGYITGIQDLSKHLHKSGLIVQESVGRRRSYIEVNPKMYGLNLSEKSSSTKEFFKEHVKQGKMSFIPDSYDRVLTNVEGAIRMSRRRASIGYNERFMTIESFEEFFKKFEQSKVEYLEIRDKILADWEQIIGKFKNSLRSSMLDLNSLDREAVIQQIENRIPSKQEYANSYYMKLKVEHFPAIQSPVDFREDIKELVQDGMKEEAVETMYQVIASVLNDAFSQTARMLSAMEKSDKVSARSLDAMKTAAKRIRRNNVLSNNKIDEIADKVEALGKKMSVDETSEQAELLLAVIYGYAKELEIVDSISLKDSSLTGSELISIFHIMKAS